MYKFKNQIVYSTIYNGRKCWTARDIMEIGGFYIGNVTEVIKKAKMVEGQDFLRIDNINKDSKLVKELGFEGKKSPGRLTVFFLSGIEKYAAVKKIDPDYREWLEEIVLQEMIEADKENVKPLNNNNIIPLNHPEVKKSHSNKETKVEVEFEIEEDLDISDILNKIKAMKEKTIQQERKIKNQSEVIDDLSDKCEKTEIENESLKRSVNNLRRQLLELKTMLLNNNVV